MPKYSIESKLKVVLEYLEGKTGATFLARKYNIPSSGLLRSWIRKYKSEGAAAFQKKVKQNYAYSKVFNTVHVVIFVNYRLLCVIN
ncbi:transposase [Lactococcus garvieae]|uniref:transposase n=1 Tax=Lactococcus garvieae TaxID=1363 RepID=UPI003BA346A5